MNTDTILLYQLIAYVGWRIEGGFLLGTMLLISTFGIFMVVYTEVRDYMRRRASLKEVAK